MPAKVKLISVTVGSNDKDGNPAARVGDNIQIQVRVTERESSRGGKFKLVHPGITPAPEFSFAGRYDTGDKKHMFRKRAERPQNYRGNDEFIFSARVTGSAALTDISLEAVLDCEVEVPDTARPLRTVADQKVLDLEYPVTLGVAPRLRFLVARGGNQGIASNTQNRIRDQLRVYVQLFFLDPADVERPLPHGFPVRARIGDADSMRVELTVMGKGHIAIQALGAAEATRSRHLRLELGDDGDEVILCELPGETASEAWGDVPTESDATGTLPKRFFTFPKVSLREVTCEVTNEDGRWDADEGTFALAKNNRPASLGTFGSPVKIVIKPVWQFAKFTYFDRHYGHSDHGDADVAMAPVTLQGFRARPTLPGDEPEVRSNWWVDPSDDKKFVQCVPWIRQKLQDGTAAAKPDASTELRFTLPAKTCMKSVSATERERVIATEEELKPGADRLKFYDLPTLWQAQNYYGWLSDTDGEHGFYEDIAAKPTALDKPVVFNLDDIVLTDADRRALGWTHADRLAIFAHTFDDTLTDCTTNGLYKPDTGNKKPWLSKEPASTKPESGANYVIDRPRWVRVIAADGNLFEVFDQRTQASSPATDDDVLGARAAVRWVDATTGPNGAAAGTEFAVRPALQQPADAKHFAMHPFVQQEFVSRSLPLAAGTTIDSWSAPLGDVGRFRNGRYDLALLRCCSVEADKEVGAVLRYHRFSFDYTTSVNTLQTEPTSKHEEWTRDLMVDLSKRWNGDDGVNAERARLRPQTDSTGPELKVVTVAQTCPKPKAHFHVKLVAEDETSSMEATMGTGKLRVLAANPTTNRGFAAAHETGHTGGLPDDYHPSTLGVPAEESNHIPGSPYVTDTQAMMKSNREVRARYFWPVAEWLRSVSGFANAKYEVKHGASVYKLPYLPTANVRRSLVAWPLAGKIHARPAPNGHCDVYLYLLGDDEFSRTVLPGLAGGGTFDAILVVMHIAAFSSVPVLSEARRKQLFAACNQKIHGTLNNKVIASFTVKPADGPPQVRRCLVHFMPHFVFGASARAHLDVALVNVGESLDIATGGSKNTLTVPIDTGTWDASKELVRDYYFDAFCECMGMSSDTTDLSSYTEASSYREIVKNVVANGQPINLARA